MSELFTQLQATLGDAYRLERELGGGGMSRVFLAHETGLGRKVVIKVLLPELAAGVSVDRFRREIQLAAQLQHPHIVPLLSAGQSDGLPYFTMPYIVGESLRAKIAREGELPVNETVRILRDVVAALGYAHSHGVMHRDIKPDNVLLSGGVAVVTDFGVAKALSDSGDLKHTALTSLGLALGTPAYMAPEQATGDPQTDHRADLYALGVMAYEMLAGRAPFAGRSPQATLAAHAVEIPDPIERLRPATPPSLAALVMQCLAKRPADRPQSATEVQNVLDALGTPSGGMVPTTVVTRGGVGERKSRGARTAALSALAAGLVVAAGAGALWFARSRAPAAPAAARVSPPAASAAPATQAPPPSAPPGPAPDPLAAEGPRAEASSATRAADPEAPRAAARPAEPRRAARPGAAAPRAAAAAPRHNARPGDTLVDAAGPAREAASGAAADSLAPVDSAPASPTGAGAPQPAPRVTAATTPTPPTSGSLPAPPTAPRESAATTAGPPGAPPSAPPAAAAAPAPPRPAAPPADPRPEIRAVVARYADAIRSRDIGNIRRVYPNMNASQQRAWEQFFGTVRDMRADLSVAQLKLGDGTADAQVTGTYTYLNGSTGSRESQPVAFHATFRRDASGWLISEIR